MAINLKLNKGLFVPKFYPYLFDYNSRWQIYMGSAGSAKSYFITQQLIVRACCEKIKILVCRRYGSTIRNTCFSLFKEIITKWQLLPYVKIRETDFNIRFCNGSEIVFMGLDEETKLLSLNNIGCVFVEECFEVPKPIIEQLNLRLRGNTQKQQIIMAFNPISKNHWLYDFCEINPPQSFQFIHSTYKDNPFLNAEYIAELEELYTRNPQKARVFCDGEWGIDAEGLVIQNWKTVDIDAFALASRGYEHRVGIDLGWVDKTAVINTFYDRENKTIYIFEEYYRSGSQLTEIADAIKSMNIGKTKIYVDSAEPRSIQYFRNQSINAIAANKSKDSVKAGIMFLQDNQIIVSPLCQSMIMELSNFSYIRSKQTGEYTEDTTHEYSHAIDALRYAYSDIYTNTKLKTINKSILNL
jgi:phage terminase large subunit